MNDLKYEFTDEYITPKRGKRYGKYDELFASFLKSDKKTCIITPPHGRSIASLVNILRVIAKKRNHNVLIGKYGATQIYMTKFK